MYDSTKFSVLSIHWGTWNVFPADEGDDCTLNCSSSSLLSLLPDGAGRPGVCSFTKALPGSAALSRPPFQGRERLFCLFLRV